MSKDDTFFGSGGEDRTVLRPQPGKRPRTGAQPQPAAPPPLPQAGALPRVDGSDINRLVGAAAALLALAGKLRNTMDHPDPASLFKHVAQEIKNYEAAARAVGVEPNAVEAGSYSLCTLLDQVVLNTPWGHRSVWASQSLLSLFHKEGWGGEKFFQVLERLLQQPAGNLELLELMYFCMAMGLQGKYREQPRQLETIQASVVEAIRKQRGELDPSLSPNWRGVQDARPGIGRQVPFWVVAASAAGLLLLVFFGLRFSLSAEAVPVRDRVAALGRDIPELENRQAFVAPQRLRLPGLLSLEVQQGLLEVRQDGAAETVILGEGLFPSGSDTVVAERVELIDSVGRALNQIDGRVLITGHTDNVPIGTLRFPSNWHLSKGRAEAVQRILAERVDAARLVAEPRAASEPRASNDTAAGRALNRRVEITLFATPTRE